MLVGDVGPCLTLECVGFCSLDPEHPIQTHVGIEPDPFAYWAPETGAGVRGHDEQGHWLSRIVRVPKEVCNTSSDVAKGRTARDTTKKHENDHHGEVQSQSATLVKHGRSVRYHPLTNNAFFFFFFFNKELTILHSP